MFRVATWNVQRGVLLDAIAWRLAAEKVDLALLQECDVGMLRSGNRHVPREIARLWPGADFRISIEFEEEGLGNGEERRQLLKHTRPEDLRNSRGLHCNAIVGRGMSAMSCEVKLWNTEDWVDHPQQPRRGGRTALVTRVGQVHFANVHLESAGTPAKRGAQFMLLLKALEELRAAHVVIGGDVNCKEGTDELLFELAEVFGYRWRDANLDEGRYAGRRFDWFFYRGVEVSNPRTIDATGVCDHDLMTLDVRV